jgi:hypothetical protein
MCYKYIKNICIRTKTNNILFQKKLLKYAKKTTNINSLRDRTHY